MIEPVFYDLPRSLSIRSVWLLLAGPSVPVEFRVGINERSTVDN